MIKYVTKFIEKQMHTSKDMVRVKSIADHEHFRPLSLLIEIRKPRCVFHPAPKYQWTGFTLDDVLLPGEDGKSTESLVQAFSQFTLSTICAGKAAGGLSVSAGDASAKIKGGASSSRELSIKPQKKAIPLESLEALRRERQINMDHSFIQQLQTKGINLFLVIETLEASEDINHKDSTKAKGGFRAKFYARKLRSKGSAENSQIIVIPKGCTLAFRAIKMEIRNGVWYLEHFRGTSNRSLPCDLEADGKQCILQLPLAQFSTALGPSQGILEAVMEEVKNCCHIFSKLSPRLMLIVLNTLKAVMRDNNLFQELSQKMEEVSEENDGYELKTESPDLKDLFSTLQQFPRDRILLLAKGITYILDALHVLMEDQLLLLLESLERKILSQQLKLIENLLQHNLEKRKEPFHVDAGLLAFPHKEEQELTMALVELSGVQLQEDGSALPRHQPFEAVAALFVVLYALNLLSASE